MSSTISIGAVGPCERSRVRNDRTPRRSLPPTLKNLLDSERVVPLHMSLVEICDGEQVTALFLRQGLYWTERTSDTQGWFYKSQKEWEHEMGLTRHQGDRVREVL